MNQSPVRKYLSVPGRIAVFDFDETLTSKDSLLGYLRYLLDRLRLRAWFAIAVRWLTSSMDESYPIRKARLSAILWAATAGMPAKTVARYTEEFIEEFLNKPGGARIYPEAVEKLRWHVEQGHQIVILSAGIDRQINLCMKKIAPGLPYTAICSTERRLLGGTVVDTYCSGQVKIPCAYAAGLPREQWGYAYSDSARDLPMLRHAKKRILVNPTPADVEKVRRSVGDDFETVRWGSIPR